MGHIKRTIFLIGLHVQMYTMCCTDGANRRTMCAHKQMNDIFYYWKSYQIGARIIQTRVSFEKLLARPKVYANPLSFFLSLKSKVSHDPTKLNGKVTKMLYRERSFFFKFFQVIVFLCNENFHSAVMAVCCVMQATSHTFVVSFIHFCFMSRMFW